VGECLVEHGAWEGEGARERGGARAEERDELKRLARPPSVVSRPPSVVSRVVARPPSVVSRVVTRRRRAAAAAEATRRARGGEEAHVREERAEVRARRAEDLRQKKRVPELRRACGVRIFLCLGGGPLPIV
jgi:hypothetical protein